jgi:hypothetical protein
MTQQDQIRLKVPKQTLERCQFFELNSQSINQWIDELPKANLGQTAKQLYQAIKELNLVKMPPAQRQQLLETLRKPIYYVSRSLARHYLNQPLVLPERPRLIAELAETLHRELAVGHTIVTAHTAALKQTGQLKDADQLLSLSIHRAISDHSMNLVRFCQLYQPAPEGFWQHLHQFYLLAARERLLDSTITDTEIGSCTLIDSYKRALLLGCCRPNQMLQSHFGEILQLFTPWTDKVALGDDNQDSLLLLDPHADRPALYRDQAQSAEASLLALDFTALSEELKRLLSQADKLGLIQLEDRSVSGELLQHLLHCWSNQKQRQATRFNSDNNIDLCLGLSATHHFISGELSFEALLCDRNVRSFKLDDNPFLKAQTTVRSKDIWDSPYQANVGQIDVSLESIQYGGKHKAITEPVSKEKYSHHQASTLNFSATGYCISWPSEVPAQIKPGEIVGLRESRNQEWSIAVIRWAENQQDGAPQLGLELLCPSGAPYGARILHKKGDKTQYMRALVLPEIPLINQPYTLLTAKVPFREGQKVVLNQQGRELTIILGKKINETGNYSQFIFKKADSLLHSDDHHSSKSNGINSLWDSL